MTTTLYFENIHTKKRFKVIAIDAEKGEVTLKGETATFPEPYSKERMQELGYKLVKVEEEEAP